uniref:Ovule protein n=1 Tax=Ditylenchus dipsaci TaxID=166011 RepID=A0A915DL34_9BILA
MKTRKSTRWLITSSTLTSRPKRRTFSWKAVIQFKILSFKQISKTCPAKDSIFNRKRSTRDDQCKDQIPFVLLISWDISSYLLIVTNCC